MSDGEVKTHENFILPASVVSHIDVARLVSEVERLDNALTSAAVRDKAGAEGTEIPVYSEQLTEFVEKNALTFDEAKERERVVKELRLLKDKAPILHMTFAVPADRESLQALASWARESVHPQALISAGLQPALVAGVYLRTPNHVHDYSLRAVLAGKRDSLVKELETLRG